jgi:hypothetical protein
VVLKRLTPKLRQQNFGFIQLWRDELVEIIRLMDQLDDVQVRVEADDYLLEDVEGDLPKVGSRRLQHFTAIATRSAGAEPPRELMRIVLSARDCEVKATDPDFQAQGIMGEICNVVGRCGRSPRPLIRAACRWTAGFGLRGALLSVIISFAYTAILSIAASVVLAVTDSVPRHLSSSITYDAILASGGLLLIAMETGTFLGRSIIYTASRAEAPTWWQQYRSTIFITLVVSAFFFLIGLIVSSLGIRPGRLNEAEGSRATPRLALGAHGSA